MFKNYTSFFRHLNNIFEKKFKYAMKSFDKKKISVYNSEIYNKWLYSAIEKDSCVTPANIFSALSQNSNVFPAIKKNFDKKLSVEPLNYSVENHPIVNDLKIIVQNFVLVYDLELDFDLENPDVKNILSMLSICEINYLEYLKIICLKLNLFEILPSIHCKKLWPGKNAGDFFKNKPEEIFDLIFDITIQIFYENLCALLDIEKNYDDCSFFINLFDFYNCPINKLLMEILHFCNIDEKSFALVDGHNFFNDCVYFLNIAVNRFFFLPFGHYLKLITPIYSKPFNFKTTFTLLEKYIDEGTDIWKIFDYADTKFVLTNLGKKYLEIETTDLSQRLSEKEIEYIINNFECINEKKYPNPDSLLGYKFKIEIEKNPQYWKTFDFSGQITLYELFLIICREFFLPIDSKYSFIKDKNELVYNFDNSHKISLNQLHLSNNDIFYFIAHNQINHYVINNSKLIENHVKLKIYVHKSEMSIKNILFDYKLCRCAKKFDDINSHS